MSANNVVKFPRVKTSPQTEEEMEMFLENNKRKFIDNIVDHYGVQLLTKLATHGIEIDRIGFMDDYIFTMELLRASISRNLGLTHPASQLLDSPDYIKYFYLPPEVTKDS